jgi:hypothetical protein
MGHFCVELYKDISIPPHITQHHIKFDTTIALIHQKWYLNYVAVVKQDMEKPLSVGFIALVEETSWLLPIVIVPKKTVNSRSVWIFDNSMLQPRKIHILYLLLKRLYTK